MDFPKELSTFFSMPLGDPLQHIFNSTQLASGVSIIKHERLIIIIYFKEDLCQTAGAPCSCPIQCHLLFLLGFCLSVTGLPHVLHPLAYAAQTEAAPASLHPFQELPFEMPVAALSDQALHTGRGLLAGQC